MVIQSNNNNNNNNGSDSSNTNNNIAVVYDLEAQSVIANPPSNTQLTMPADGEEQNKQFGRTRRKRFPIAEVLTNFAFIIVAGLATESILRLIGPYKRGFFCEDDSIRLPFKAQSVPVGVLLTYSFMVPLLAFALGEHLRLTNPKTATEQICIYEANEPRGIRTMIRCIFFQGYFLIALIATLIFTSMAKFPVGRLRPHFIDICRPNIKNHTDFCDHPENQHLYIDINDYVCTSGSPFQIAEARLSFFSGHSSLAMCTAVFTCIYLHARLFTLFRYVVIVPLVQIALLSSAMLIAYSRIQDHMHHWSDVLIGMITGSGVASFLAFNIVGFTLKSSHGLGQYIHLADCSANNDENNIPTGSTTSSNNNDNNIGERGL